jgi:hypothetical protein
MYYDLKMVEPLEDYILLLTYNNGEKRRFDVKPYLHLGIFKELKDEKMFASVRKVFDTIEWANEADLDPEVLYHDSIKVS